MTATRECVMSDSGMQIAFFASLVSKNEGRMVAMRLTLVMLEILAGAPSMKLSFEN